MKALYIALSLLLACNIYPAPKADKDQEVTFFKACWRPDGAGLAEYPRNPEQIATSCKTPHEITWPDARMPLRVKIILPDGHPYTPLVKGAMEDWNKAAGRTIFVEAKIAGDVYVLDGGLMNFSAIAATAFYKDAGNHMITAVEIYGLLVLLPDTEKQAVLMHEFGHVLGLGHDFYNKSSLMAPKQDPSQRLTPADRKAIRDRYGCSVDIARRGC